MIRQVGKDVGEAAFLDARALRRGAGADGGTCCWSSSPPAGEHFRIRNDDDFENLGSTVVPVLNRFHSCAFHVAGDSGQIAHAGPARRGQADQGSNGWAMTVWATGNTSWA